MRIVQVQNAHDRREDDRQQRHESRDCSREVLQDGSSSSVDDSDTESDSNSSDDDSTDGDTSADTDIYNEQEQGDATTIDYMADACRLFPWKDDQKALANELWNLMEMPHINDDVKTDALLKLVKSFIFVTVRGDVFSSGLLHFLAVLSIDEEMGRLREANDFSYMLAGVVYDTRIFAVEAILPSTERDRQDEEDDRNFLSIRERYLTDGGYSPMSKMISLLAYGKLIARDHGNQGSVLWDDDKKVVSLHGRKIPVTWFKSLVTGGITDAEKILWKKVM
ncbi:hypothetical protein KCU81_g9929, partial [Aureobasidium melanogenum]